MQEAAQFISVVEPENDSLADRASFPSQIPAPVPLDSVLFRERHHDLIDAVHQRSTVLSAVAQNAFELLLTAFSLFWDEGTKNGPDRSALLGHNFVYQETKPHGFYSSYFHQRISS